MWQLAINNLAGRKGRTLLLILAVALSASLAVMISVMARSMEASILRGIDRLVGRADLRVVPATRQGSVDLALRDWLEGLPEVTLVIPYLETRTILANPENMQEIGVSARAVDARRQADLFHTVLREGRLPEQPGEIALDMLAKERLDARLGMVLDVDGGFGDPLTIVGFFNHPPIALVPQFITLVTFEQAEAFDLTPGSVDRLDIVLAGDTDLDGFVARHEPQLPAGVEFQTPSAARAGINRILRTMNFSLVGVIILVYTSSAFIVVITMTTAVSQRTRELAILRCIGAGRSQIAGAQLLSGLIIAMAGASLGVPLGLMVAHGMAMQEPVFFEAGVVVRWFDITGCVLAAALTGVLGAAYPAWLASRVSPLRALVMRARAGSPRTPWICLAIGLVLIVVPPVMLGLNPDPQQAFWMHAFVGAPITFLGYFLLCLPVLLLLLTIVLPPLARLLHVPPELARGSMKATPLRHALTGGGLMIGLTMLIATWAIGRGSLGSFSDGLKMPQVFAFGVSISESQLDNIRQIDGINRVCPSAMRSVELLNMQFGIEGFTPPATRFISFQPECFFSMASLDWVRGDPDTALRRLEAGGAILVSREYRLAFGVDVGDIIEVRSLTRDPETDEQYVVPLEIAGVVSNRGLDLAVQALGMQGTFDEVAVAFLFGSEADGRVHFGIQHFDMAMISLHPHVTDVDAIVDQIRARGRVEAISGAAVLDEVNNMADRVMWVSSMLALASLLIASAGVGNLVAAEISARKFEYGVIRAIGSPKHLVARLIILQTILVGLVGCLLGSLAGAQAALIREALAERLLGFGYTTAIPWDVAAIGWVLVLAGALLAAALPIRKLVKHHPRELLAADAA